jgi:hypothetical protein
MSSSISTTDAASTNRLVRCGVIAGPLFAIVGLTQAFTRPGFDLRRHTLSLLEKGDWGWIQTGNFLVTGLLFVAGAVGLRRALRGGRGGTWGPLLIGLFGAGMVGAGIFQADPIPGFPPGTPTSATTVSWHGVAHFVVASVAFLALIAALLLVARRFAAEGDRGWAAYGVATAVIFFVAFAGEASGQLLNSAFVFVFAALHAFVGASLMAARRLRASAPVRLSR